MYVIKVIRLLFFFFLCYDITGDLMKKISLLSFIWIIVDFSVKLIIHNNISLFSSVNVIPNFFSLTYVRNTGAAFSILEGKRIIFIIIALFAIYFIYKFLIKDNELKKYDVCCYSLLIGGIIGNLIDRVIYGYVIDYLSFNILGYNAPIFNLADTFIVISVILLVVKSFKEEVCKK